MTARVVGVVLPQSIDVLFGVAWLQQNFRNRARFVRLNAKKLASSWSPKRS